jgi:hypothetical protein
MNFRVFLTVPIVLVFLMVSFQLIDSFNNEAFSALDNATNNTILFPTMIKLLLGIIGLVLVVLFIDNIFNEFKRRDTPV